MKNEKIIPLFNAADPRARRFDLVKERPMTQDGTYISEYHPCVLGATFAEHLEWSIASVEVSREWIRNSKMWKHLYDHIAKSKRCVLDRDISMGYRASVSFNKPMFIYAGEVKGEKLFCLPIDIGQEEKSLAIPIRFVSKFNVKEFEVWLKDTANKRIERQKASKEYHALERLVRLNPTTAKDILSTIEQEERE